MGDHMSVMRYWVCQQWVKTQGVKFSNISVSVREEVANSRFEVIVMQDVVEW